MARSWRKKEIKNEGENKRAWFDEVERKKIEKKWLEKKKRGEVLGLGLGLGLVKKKEKGREKINLIRKERETN